GPTAKRPSLAPRVGGLDVTRCAVCSKVDFCRWQERHAASPAAFAARTGSVRYGSASTSAAARPNPTSNATAAIVPTRRESTIKWEMRVRHFNPLDTADRQYLLNKCSQRLLSVVGGRSARPALVRL